MTIQRTMRVLCVAAGFCVMGAAAQSKSSAIDLSLFEDSAHHWYDIAEEEKVITPLDDQKKYAKEDVANIADNILLYQKENGGWPKNYDMQAILTPEQKEAVRKSFKELNTTIDNGATHSHIAYLAQAFTQLNDARYKEAALRGIDYLLDAQYDNGGWPQFWPDVSGYRKYITFNDGAMGGVMEVFGAIASNKPQYAFVDEARREKVRAAFQKGIDCILACQIKQNGKLTAWCQQHDNIDLRPQNARAFEPASISSLESAGIVRFLMNIEKPSKEVIAAVESAVQWFRDVQILGIKVETIDAPKTKFLYQTVDFDRVVVKDPDAPPIWARMYELETQRPLFCNRDNKPVYSLAEVDRERRTGYGWYGDAPASVLKKYEKWKKKIDKIRLPEKTKK